MNIRPATVEEINFIDSLFGDTPQIRSKLSSQLNELSVSEIDNNGSLMLKPVQGEKAIFLSRIPVEALASMKDDATVEVLLHVVDGWLHELEILPSDPAQKPMLKDLKIVDVSYRV